MDLADLKSRHVPGRRLLGLDIGTKTIGLALSDGLLTIANPLTVLRRTRFSADAERLRDIVADRDVFGLVAGLPVNMDGSEGPRCQSARAFIRNLSAKFEIPTVFWDERLSTVAAERAMIDADLSRKKRSEKIDAVAASIILQGALDRMARL